MKQTKMIKQNWKPRTQWSGVSDGFHLFSMFLVLIRIIDSLSLPFSKEALNLNYDFYDTRQWPQS